MWCQSEAGTFSTRWIFGVVERVQGKGGSASFTSGELQNSRFVSLIHRQQQMIKRPIPPRPNRFSFLIKSFYISSTSLRTMAMRDREDCVEFIDSE